jgi:hypothetical protein
MLGILLVLILITNTKVELLFQRYGYENDFVSIKVTVLNIVKLKKNFTMIDIVNKGGKLAIQFKPAEGAIIGDEDRLGVSFERVKCIIAKTNLLISNTHNFLKKIRQVLSGFKILKFSWVTHIGIDDAVILGPIIGGSWILKSSMLQLFFYFFPLQTKPNIHINPEYHQNVFKTQMHCIFQFKVGYAIYAGIKLIYIYKKGVQHV